MGATTTETAGVVAALIGERRAGTAATLAATWGRGDWAKARELCADAGHWLLSLGRTEKAHEAFRLATLAEDRAEQAFRLEMEAEERMGG